MVTGPTPGESFHLPVVYLPSGMGGCTHSLEGFCLCEGIQTDCDGEGTDQSRDLSHHTLG